MSVRTLSEVTSELGVSRRAIQGYEKEGLLQPSSKNDRGWLLYDDSCVEQIKKIQFFQKIGLKRKEILEYEKASSKKQRQILECQYKKLQSDIARKEELCKRIKELLECEKYSRIVEKE